MECKPFSFSEHQIPIWIGGSCVRPWPGWPLSCVPKAPLFLRPLRSRMGAAAVFVGCVGCVTRSCDDHFSICSIRMVCLIRRANHLTAKHTVRWTCRRCRLISQLWIGAGLSTPHFYSGSTQPIRLLFSPCAAGFDVALFGLRAEGPAQPLPVPIGTGFDNARDLSPERATHAGVYRPFGAYHL